MAETNGLLNRRTGKSGTEGSNPSVSASFVGHATQAALCEMAVVEVIHWRTSSQSLSWLPCSETFLHHPAGHLSYRSLLKGGAKDGAVITSAVAKGALPCESCASSTKLKAMIGAPKRTKQPRNTFALWRQVMWPDIAINPICATATTASGVASEPVSAPCSQFAAPSNALEFAGSTITFTSPNNRNLLTPR